MSIFKKEENHKKAKCFIGIVYNDFCESLYI